MKVFPYKVYNSGKYTKYEIYITDYSNYGKL
jgi:methyl coenzyme M reductase subunit D